MLWYIRNNVSHPSTLAFNGVRCWTAAHAQERSSILLTCIRRYEGRTWRIAFTVCLLPAVTTTSPLFVDQNSLRCRILHQLRQNSAATRSKRSKRIEHRVYCRSDSRGDTLGIARSSIMCMRMASYASPSPLHVERNRGNIVEIDGAGSGVAVSRTTDIFTDIIEGAGRLSCGCTKTVTVAQWNLDVCFSHCGVC